MTALDRGGPGKRRRRYLLEEFLELDQQDFLAESFRRILGREPDPESYQFFDRAMRDGTMFRIDVLGHLRAAPEGRRRGVKIHGLTRRFWLSRFSKRLSSPNDAGPRHRPASAAASQEPSFAAPFSQQEVAALNGLWFAPNPTAAASEAAFWAGSSRAAIASESTECWGEREGLAFATLCTASHLPAARALLASVHAHHPDASLYLLLIDGARDVDLPCPATVLLPGDLQVPRLPFLALKYSALDLCCALKPFLMRHLLDHTAHAKLVYLDSDILVFRRLDELTRRLDDAAFVVTPHLVAPIGESWRFWERPSLGDLAHSGVFNAGMFGLRATAAGRWFLGSLCELVTAPGAFHVSGQTEQHSFNWITAFCDDVAVLRDTTYNVAYWNLHDRSLRDRRLDRAEDPASWTVDGRALAAFHFSGFSPAAPWALSKYDGRYSTHVLPSVRSILDHYCDQLVQHRSSTKDVPYQYDQWPSGSPIDDRMRSIFKEYEVQLDRDVDPWSEAGERYFAGLLMRPMPGSGSLLPILWEEVYRTRPDLQALFPSARTSPSGMLRWAASHGAREYEYGHLFDRHRLRSPSSRGARLLLAVWLAPSESDDEDGGRSLAAVTSSRRDVIEYLRDRGESAVANDVASLAVERVETTCVGMVRRLVEEERPDLKTRFRDLLFGAAHEMTRWLVEEGEPGYLLPAGAAQAFERCSNGRSLARIFSFVNAQWRLGAQFPLAFVGQDREAFAEMLLRALRTGCQYDIEDVAMYLWVTAEKPSAGVDLTFELLPNLARQPPPWTIAGQEALLGRLAAEPEFAAALESHRLRHGTMPCSGHLPNGQGHGPITVWELMADRGDGSAAAGSAATPDAGPGSTTLRAGVNMFGYFRSPTGLGMQSRGLAAAVEATGLRVSRNLLGNVAMDGDLSPEDFVRKFEFEYDTNLFCSYPHFDELLVERLPPAMVDGRRNVVHLAWEQRDGMELWRRVFERFDQVWAVSAFAAEALGRFLGREVLAVPDVVDFESFPSAARKADLGLDEGRVSFLNIFDANSSVERKNPGAVIEAFTRAFAGAQDVELIIKISGASRVEHRERLQKLVGSAVRQGSQIRVIARDLSRTDVLRLISAADYYVSLHRAEGFGYTCAEAMAYGKPVIATGYSGNLQYMGEANSYLVRWREVEVSSADGPFPRGSVWAEPDVDHAAQLMREVVAGREAALGRGERGARDVRAICSVEAVAQIVARALGTRAALPSSARGRRAVVAAAVPGAGG